MPQISEGICQAAAMKLLGRSVHKDAEGAVKLVPEEGAPLTSQCAPIIAIGVGRCSCSATVAFGGPIPEEPLAQGCRKDI